MAALAAAIQSAKRNYTLVFWDCSGVTTQALKAAGKKDGEPAFGDGYDVKDAIDIGADDIDHTPKSKHRKIKKRNSDARNIE